MNKFNLDGQYHVLQGRLPDELIPDVSGFEAIWDLHPEEFHDIKMHGRTVKTPRWQQAYNKDYAYSGSKNNALPIPDVLAPYYTWCRENIDSCLNGILLNWYDGNLNHYIGKHRDSTKGCLLYTSPSPRDQRGSRMPSSA